MSENGRKKDPFIGQIIFDKFKVIKKVGRGSFGNIYLVVYNNKLYAMKLEDINKEDYFELEKELFLMSHLYGPRIPYVKSFGNYGLYNVLIMEILGKSLEDIKSNLPSKKMSISCVCKLSYQMLQILEHIHKKSFIHRDIKPDNFVMGLGSNSKFLFMIDFGFATTYRDPNTLAHVPFQKDVNIIGTPRFSSINTLKGFTQSRRDDIESLGYVIIYIAKGTLPWASIKGDNQEGLYNRILEVKSKTTPEKLCKGLPPQFLEYINYARRMTFEQEPDYKYLRNLFLTALQNYGGKMDYCYDWDNSINNMNIYLDNTTMDKFMDAERKNTQSNSITNIEKIYNEDNALKACFNNQVKIAIQNNIYNLDEINESGIDTYSVNSIDNNDTTHLQNRNMTYQNGMPVINRPFKKEQDCCSIM